MTHSVASVHPSTWGVCVDHSPTVRGRRLVRDLKRLREASGMGPDEVAQRLDFSKSKLYRIENGKARVDHDDLEDMLDLFDVRSPERDALVALGRDSRRRGWWTTYKDVFTGSYVGLESEAARIQVASHIVPGLFQTGDYARAVIAATAPWLDAFASCTPLSRRPARLLVGRVILNGNRHGQQRTCQIWRLIRPNGMASRRKPPGVIAEWPQNIGFPDLS